MSQVTQSGASPNARFLEGEVSSSRLPVKRAGHATLASCIVHMLFVLLVLLAIASRPTSPPATVRNALSAEIVWIAADGPGGGGGGGGDKRPEPPRRAESEGVQKITVPVDARTTEVADEPPPPQTRIEIPAQQVALGLTELPGMISTVPTPGVLSQGSGDGGGAGTGKGTGLGAGLGSGLDEGAGGSSGGDVFRPGLDVVSPAVLHEEPPEYTSGAMSAKVQGIVEIEAVVETDGTVGRVQIVRSLDDRFGLDDKALEAVKRWRFRPGTKQGKPVAVLVNIELTFTLR